jgi:hypothetical protein
MWANGFYYQNLDLVWNRTIRCSKIQENAEVSNRPG